METKRISSVSIFLRGATLIAALLFGGACSQTTHAQPEPDAALVKSHVDVVSAEEWKQTSNSKFPAQKDTGAGTDLNACAPELARADSVNALLAYPTLTASIDKQGEGQASLSYDLVNLHTIELNHRKALADCRVREILKVAGSLRDLSARNLARHGTEARIRFLRSALIGIEAESRRSKSAGLVDQREQKRISGQISRTRDLISRLSSRASTMPLIEISSYRPASNIIVELESALIEQQALIVQGDQAKAVRLTISGGYRYETSLEDDETSRSGGFGRAALQLRLGVFSDEWKRAKARELDVAFSSLLDTDRGVITNIMEIHSGNEAALDALRQRRSDLQENLLALRKEPSQDEKPGKEILDRFAALPAESEIAEINAVVSVIERAQQKLALAYP